MLQTLVLGLGRTGAALHLPALAKIGEAGLPGVFANHPIAAYDPRPVDLPHLPRVRVTGDLGEAMALVDPGSAVAHLCTPPGSRLTLLEELARNGFRRFVVEKPLGAGRRELDRIGVLRRRFGLELAVVAPWLAADLPGRLAKLARSGEFGALRSVTVNLHQPRFHRSLSLDHGIVTGYYPLCAEDDHPQLEVVSPHRSERAVFRDDALTAFFLRTYRAFRAGRPTGLEVHERAARLLIEAKERCGLVASNAS